MLQKTVTEQTLSNPDDQDGTIWVKDWREIVPPYLNFHDALSRCSEVDYFVMTGRDLNARDAHMLTHIHTKLGHRTMKYVHIKLYDWKSY